MTDIVWIERSVVLAIHEAQITEHGGAVGVRDAGLLDSALGRPEMKAQFGEENSTVLAAAYAFGIARNHPFVDGNKRTALVVAETFLDLNGMGLAASDEDTVLTFLSLAAGDLSEEELAAWMRRHAGPKRPETP